MTIMVFGVCYLFIILFFIYVNVIIVSIVGFYLNFFYFLSFFTNYHGFFWFCLALIMLFTHTHMYIIVILFGFISFL
ncbi:hypothetical protein DsansV1_C28g0205981 [Dioscorea sansibarensis]